MSAAESDLPETELIAIEARAAIDHDGPFMHVTTCTCFALQWMIVCRRDVPRLVDKVRSLRLFASEVRRSEEHVAEASERIAAERDAAIQRAEAAEAKLAAAQAAITSMNETAHRAYVAGGNGVYPALRTVCNLADDATEALALSASPPRPCAKCAEVEEKVAKYEVALSEIGQAASHAFYSRDDDGDEALVSIGVMVDAALGSAPDAAEAEAQSRLRAGIDAEHARDTENIDFAEEPK